ncbi:hypothetical protein QBC35DRAFT_64274 [Podospora australis]|uniref:Uncharacterized protein n=1 Tax=Podospora australis TaxID=1536484 RepID=A0AAN6WYH4_9PEZI|nr:hypothetical protein QBC35DRAFT_64274 [Podospora australis]
MVPTTCSGTLSWALLRLFFFLNLCLTSSLRPDQTRGRERGKITRQGERDRCILSHSTALLRPYSIHRLMPKATIGLLFFSPLLLEET